MNPQVSSIDIAVSGLRAQQMKMRVISNNIANADTVDDGTGQPFVRKDLILQTGEGIDGVQVQGVVDDTSSDFRWEFDAAKGWIAKPNVSLPNEMVDLIFASRAYQANAAVMKRFQDSVDVTLELIR